MVTVSCDRQRLVRVNDGVTSMRVCSHGKSIGQTCAHGRQTHTHTDEWEADRNIHRERRVGGARTRCDDVTISKSRQGCDPVPRSVRLFHRHYGFLLADIPAVQRPGGRPM